MLKSREVLQDAAPRFLLHTLKTFLLPKKSPESQLDPSDVVTSGGFSAVDCRLVVLGPLPFAHGSVAERARVALKCGLFESVFALANHDGPPAGVVRMTALAHAAARCPELSQLERIALRWVGLCAMARDAASFEEFLAAFEREAAALSAASVKGRPGAALRVQCLALLELAATARAVEHDCDALLERGPLSASALAKGAYEELLSPSQGGKLETLLVSNGRV